MICSCATRTSSSAVLSSARLRVRRAWGSRGLTARRCNAFSRCSADASCSSSESTLTMAPCKRNVTYYSISFFHERSAERHRRRSARRGNTHTARSIAGPDPEHAARADDGRADAGRAARAAEAYAEATRPTARPPGQEIWPSTCLSARRRLWYSFLPMSQPETAGFERILEYLRETRGFDFTAYKRMSLMRRGRQRLEAGGIDEVDSLRGFL